MDSSVATQSSSYCTLFGFVLGLIYCYYSSTYSLCLVEIMASASSASNDSATFNINELNGNNFNHWKTQIWQVLVQTKQVRPLKTKGIKVKDWDREDWDELDELCKSTIIFKSLLEIYSPRLWIVSSFSHSKFPKRLNHNYRHQIGQ